MVKIRTEGGGSMCFGGGGGMGNKHRCCFPPDFPIDRQKT